MSDTPKTDAVARINEYLGVGGFFNPEILNVQQHEAVRDTLIQARDELNAANAKIKWLEEAFDAAEGLIAVNSCECPYDDEVFHCSSCVQAINRYIKLKRTSRER